MKMLIALFATLVVTSCASTKSIPAPSPTEAFKVYQTEATKENISVNASKYFSETLLKGKDLTDQAIQNQLLFKDYMADGNQDVYQVQQANSACVTINGYDKEQLPVTFNLAYLKTNNAWLIAEIAVVFHESDSEFESRGKCPT